MNTDNDTACIRSLNSALDICAAIRRDVRWTRSSDAASRHEAILADFEVNFIPLGSAVFAAGARALIGDARSAFAA